MINLKIPIAMMLPKKLKYLPNNGFTIGYSYSFVVLDDLAEPFEISSNLGSPNQNSHSITIAFSDHEEVAC
jgi:hypothetical protein